MTKTFKRIESHRATADGNLGAAYTTTIEVLTERDGGVYIDARVTGSIEGYPADNRSAGFYPGVTMAAAVAYRLSHGYTEVL